MAKDEQHGTDGTPVHQAPADNSNTGRVAEPSVGRAKPTTGRVESSNDYPTGRIEEPTTGRVEKPTTGRVRT